MSFNVVFELRVSSPTGVFKNTIPALVRQTDPRNVMLGSASVGSALAGLLSAGGAGAGASVVTGSAADSDSGTDPTARQLVKMTRRIGRSLKVSWVARFMVKS